MDNLHTRWLLIAALSLVIISCKKDDADPQPTIIGGVQTVQTTSVTDIDGNTYFVIPIGNQYWMTENLRTTRYADGTAIPLTEDVSSWIAAGTAGMDARCVYDNSVTHGAVYGNLYNWYAATSAHHICPQGWHIPTDAEWAQMEAVLGMPTDELYQAAHRGLAQNVGGRLKSTTLWQTPNLGATNASAFSGLPSGYRSGSTGGCEVVGRFGAWWSSTTAAQDASLAWSRALNFDNLGVDRSSPTKTRGHCLRCIQD